MTEKEEKDLKALNYYREQNIILKEQVEFHKQHYLITKYTALRYKYIGLISQFTNTKDDTSKQDREEVQD